jgi:hypothetical protein
MMSGDASARKPSRSFDADSRDVFKFVNLEGQLEEFDISDPAHANFSWHRVHVGNREPTEDDPERCIWHGKAADRLNESLFRMLGGRWVLVYSELDAWAERSETSLPLNRELTPKEACIWLRWVNGYTAPVELREFNSHVVGTLPARLEPDWKPGSATSVRRPLDEAAVAAILPDLIERTTAMLGRAVSQIELIQFLAKREKRSAEMKTIVTEHYSHPLANSQRLRTARRLAERTRDKLEAEGCPIKLTISGSVVRLIVVDPVA